MTTGGRGAPVGERERHPDVPGESLAALGRPSMEVGVATMRRHGYQRQALIETLHTVQQSFGYLDPASLRFVAGSLRVPLSQAYGVATFYHFFGLKPPGEHTCVVCMGTACYIKGAPALLADAEKSAGLKPGETTLDGKISFLTARCLGSCSLAPAVVFDGEVTGKVEPAELRSRLQGWANHAS